MRNNDNDERIKPQPGFYESTLSTVGLTMFGVGAYMLSNHYDQMYRFIGSFNHLKWIQDLALNHPSVSYPLTNLKFAISGLFLGKYTGRKLDKKVNDEIEELKRIRGPRSPFLGRD